MAKPEQFDILGQPLEPGNYVAVGKGNAMYICQVCKITPKMIRAKLVNKKDHVYRGHDNDGMLIYSSNTVKLSGEDAVAYILKYAG
jgi:hypothetical protein